MIKELTRNGSVVICSVSALHIFQAVMILTWPSAGAATGLLGIWLVCHDILRAPDGMHFVAAVMLVSAGMALIGTLCSLGRVRLSLFMLQHLLLGIMAGAGVLASVRGTYLDGTIIPWQHIATDQAIILAFFVAHSWAILERSFDE